MKSLKVPEDVWLEVKVAAAKKGITIIEFVTEALKSKLKREGSS